MDGPGPEFERMAVFMLAATGLASLVVFQILKRKGEWTATDWGLIQIAKYQKELVRLLCLFVLLIISTVLLIIISRFPGPLKGNLVWLPGEIALMAVAGIGPYLIIRLATTLGDLTLFFVGVFVILLYFCTLDFVWGSRLDLYLPVGLLATFVTVVTSGVIFLANLTAASALRRHGVRVEFMGARENDLQKIRASLRLKDKHRLDEPVAGGTRKTTDEAQKQPTKTGKKLRAKEVVTDIKAGLDDQALMAKYDLSLEQLTRMYTKLRNLNLIGDSELRHRAQAENKVPDSSVGRESKSGEHEGEEAGILTTSFRRVLAGISLGSLIDRFLPNVDFPDYLVPGILAIKNLLYFFLLFLVVRYFIDGCYTPISMLYGFSDEVQSLMPRMFGYCIALYFAFIRE